MDSDIEGTKSPEVLDLKLFNDSNLLSPIPKEFISLQPRTPDIGANGGARNTQPAADTESSVTLVELEECFSQLGISTRLPTYRFDKTRQPLILHPRPSADSKIPVFSRGWDKIKDYVFSGSKNTVRTQPIIHKSYPKSRYRSSVRDSLYSNSSCFNSAYARVPVSENSLDVSVPENSPDVPVPENSPDVSIPDNKPPLQRSSLHDPPSSYVSLSQPQHARPADRIYIRLAQKKSFTSQPPLRNTTANLPNTSGYFCPNPPAPNQNKKSCPAPPQPFTRSKKYVKAMIAPREASSCFLR